jgi:membrane-associated phospholipid phosphatase
MDTALLWGLPIITGLQSLGTFLVLPMKVLSFLGTEEFFLLVMPGMVWCVDASLGLRMGLVLLTSASFNSMLKIAFGWPRPFWVSDAVTAHAFESSYGFPSGHAQASMVLWGRMAAGLRRRAWVIGLGLLIFLISLSRLYLGVHFPSDVLAGWVVGGILLALFLLLEKPVGAWIGRQTLGLQLVIPLLAALVIIGKGAWMSAATADRVDVVSSAGTLFGLGTGAVLLRRWGKFSAKGSLGARAARFALGLVGVLLIYFGLRLILPSGEGLLPQSLRFVRYALVGLWVAYLAPWVFVRLRLA